jgi:hypothetical protein
LQPPSKSAKHRHVGRDDSRLGLVLSGGGARGAFQIGVYERLREDARFEGRGLVMSGTSSGAVNAALIAAGKSPDQMMSFWEGIASDPPVEVPSALMRSLLRVTAGMTLTESLNWAGTVGAWAFFVRRALERFPPWPGRLLGAGIGAREGKPSSGRHTPTDREAEGAESGPRQAHGPSRDQANATLTGLGLRPRSVLEIGAQRDRLTRLLRLVRTCGASVPDPGEPERPQRIRPLHPPRHAIGPRHRNRQRVREVQASIHPRAAPPFNAAPGVVAGAKAARTLFVAIRAARVS